jgi:spectinomycin phosphotransferase
MRDRPAGVADDDLIAALAAGWQLQVADARYAPVGAGSYHWVVRDNENRQWFATLDDLDAKRWLGDNRVAAFEGLRAALDVAVALRHRHDLRFVLAPVMGRNGLTVQRLGCQYAVAVFPFVNASSTPFGQELPRGDREKLVGMLAALHGCPPAALPVHRARVGLPRRDDLAAALSELGAPWSGGPFSEPARELLAASVTQIRRLLAAFDTLADHVRALEPVVTHGEPHPGNLMRTGNDVMLIDWDTAGAAPPERDLWWIVSDSDEVAAQRYTEATGRSVDRDALAFYRLRWALDDMSIYTHELRAPHRHTAGTEQAWRALKITVEGLPDRRRGRQVAANAPYSCR